MGDNAAFVLRPLVVGDAPRIAALIGEWDVVRWLSMPPYPYALRDAEEFIAHVLGAQMPVGHRTKAISIDGQLVGVIGIDQRAVGPNLGYWLSRSLWGRGVMTAAATLLTRDFFNTTRADVLTSGYFSGNEASSAIQRRLGFQVTGEGQLFNRPHGRHLPHVETVLTQSRFETASAARAPAT